MVNDQVWVVALGAKCLAQADPEIVGSGGSPRGISLAQTKPDRGQL